MPRINCTIILSAIVAGPVLNAADDQIRRP